MTDTDQFGDALRQSQDAKEEHEREERDRRSSIRWGPLWIVAILILITWWQWPTVVTFVSSLAHR